MDIKKIFDKQNIFLLLLILMVFAGKVIPYQDSYNQIFNLEAFIDWGIAGIFLLYGLKLNLKEVVKDVLLIKYFFNIQFLYFLQR